MAQQGGGFGKVVLYGVLGVIAVVVGIWFIQNILGWLLLAAVVAGVGYVAFRMGRRSVGGGPNRRQLPR